MEPSTASLMHEMRKKEAPILTPLLQRKVRSDGGEQFEYDEVRPSPLLSLSTHVTRWGGGGGLVLQVRIFFRKVENGRQKHNILLESLQRREGRHFCNFECGESLLSTLQM